MRSASGLLFCSRGSNLPRMRGHSFLHAQNPEYHGAEWLQRRCIPASLRPDHSFPGLTAFVSILQAVAVWLHAAGAGASGSPSLLRSVRVICQQADEGHAGISHFGAGAAAVGCPARACPSTSLRIWLRVVQCRGHSLVQVVVLKEMSPRSFQLIPVPSTHIWCGAGPWKVHALLATTACLPVQHRHFHLALGPSSRCLLTNQRRSAYPLRSTARAQICKTKH